VASPELVTENEPGMVPAETVGTPVAAPGLMGTGWRVRHATAAVARVGVELHVQPWASEKARKSQSGSSALASGEDGRWGTGTPSWGKRAGLPFSYSND
jgi:hypothetical protein